MYTVILDGITTDGNGERVMSGKEERLTFFSRDVAMSCFRYYDRIPIGALAPYVAWVTFFDSRVSLFASADYFRQDG